MQHLPGDTPRSVGSMNCTCTCLSRSCFAIYLSSVNLAVNISDYERCLGPQVACITQLRDRLGAMLCKSRGRFDAHMVFLVLLSTVAFKIKFLSCNLSPPTPDPTHGFYTAFLHQVEITPLYLMKSWASRRRDLECHLANH